MLSARRRGSATCERNCSFSVNQEMLFFYNGISRGALSDGHLARRARAGRSGAPRSSCSAPASRSATAAGPIRRRSYNAGYGVKSRRRSPRRHRLLRGAARAAARLSLEGSGRLQILPRRRSATRARSGDRHRRRRHRRRSSSSRPMASALRALDARRSRSRSPARVRVAVAGVEQTAGTHFTVDHATGIVTFLPGHIPAAGAGGHRRLRVRRAGALRHRQARDQSAAFEAGGHPGHSDRGDQAMRALPAAPAGASRQWRDDAVLVLAAHAARRRGPRLHRSRPRSRVRRHDLRGGEPASPATEIAGGRRAQRRQSRCRRARSPPTGLSEDDLAAGPLRRRARSRSSASIGRTPDSAC